MRNLIVGTDYGQVSFVYGGFTDKPVAVLVHGFMRSLNSLYCWSDLLPDYNVIFARLPGHNAAEIKGGVATWIQAFRMAFQGFPTAPEMVIGESVGSLVALGTRAPHIVAVEPFLSTDKLWPAHLNVAESRAKGRDPGPLYEEVLVGCNYAPLLPALASPTLVLAGTEPLMPRRSFTHAPSLLDDEDFAAFAAHPMVEAHRVPGGHVLLDQNRAACCALILEHAARHQPFLATTR